VGLPLHISVYPLDHLQGAHMPYHTNNQWTLISGIGPGNCTKYGICAPWRWFNG